MKLAGNRSSSSIKLMLLRQEKLRRNYSFALSACALTLGLTVWSAADLVVRSALSGAMGNLVKGIILICLTGILYRSVQVTRRLGRCYRDPDFIRRNVSAHELPSFWNLFKRGGLD